MKKLKFTILAVAILFATTLSAQNISYGIKAGANMSNLSGKELSDKNWKAGGHVGIVMDYEFIDNIALQTGLYFFSKGAKYTPFKVDENNKTVINTNMYYLQLPIHFAYKIPVTASTKFVLNAGPYLAYGVGGKTNTTVTLLGKSTTTDGVDTFAKLENGKEKFGGLKRFDAGLGVGVGFEVRNFTIDLGWDFGLVNISQLDNTTLKNQAGYLSLGYKF